MRKRKKANEKISKNFKIGKEEATEKKQWKRKRRTIRRERRKGRRD